MNASQYQLEKDELLREVYNYYKNGRFNEYKNFVVNKLHIKTPEQAGARENGILNTPTPTEEEAWQWICRLTVEQICSAGI